MNNSFRNIQDNNIEVGDYVINQLKDSYEVRKVIKIRRNSDDKIINVVSVPVQRFSKRIAYAEQKATAIMKKHNRIKGVKITEEPITNSSSHTDWLYPFIDVLERDWQYMTFVNPSLYGFYGNDVKIPENFHQTLFNNTNTTQKIYDAIANNIDEITNNRVFPTDNTKHTTRLFSIPLNEYDPDDEMYMCWLLCYNSCKLLKYLITKGYITFNDVKILIYGDYAYYDYDIYHIISSDLKYHNFIINDLNPVSAEKFLDIIGEFKEIPELKKVGIKVKRLNGMKAWFTIDGRLYDEDFELCMDSLNNQNEIDEFNSQFQSDDDIITSGTSNNDIDYAANNDIGKMVSCNVSLTGLFKTSTRKVIARAEHPSNNMILIQFDNGNYGYFNIPHHVLLCSKYNVLEFEEARGFKYNVAVVKDCISHMYNVVKLNSTPLMAIYGEYLFAEDFKEIEDFHAVIESDVQGEGQENLYDVFAYAVDRDDTPVVIYKDGTVQDRDEDDV